MIRPSTLPALELSPKFVAELAGEPAEAGTDRHAAFAARLRGEAGAGVFDLLTDEEKAGVEWAVDQVLLLAPTSEHPLVIEQRLEILGPDFEPLLAGTPDVVCDRWIFDLKWRERDYSAQMAAYAWLVAVNSGLDQEDAGEIHVRVLYAASKRVEVLTFTPWQAEGRVRNILADVARATVCRTSRYCAWCALARECPVLAAGPLAVAAGREDWPPELATWHASQITNPAQMALALRLRPYLRKWMEAVGHHALEMVTKQGVQIPGFKLAERTTRELTDLRAAYKALALPPEEFLACCDASLPQLEKAYAAANELKVAAAKRKVAELLEGMVTAKTSTYLRAESPESDE